MESSSSPNTYGPSCYEIAPVDRSTRTIRLLRILEAICPGETRCELKSFSLKTCPAYTALSYTWGSSPPSKGILVNGTAFAVRPNLWHFLRIAKEQEYYWIDAICIDQARTDERNHQVGLMRDIFSLAGVVHVWLGFADRKIEPAMDCLQRTHDRRQHSVTRTLWSQAEGKALLELCQLPYWRRAWIVQEVIAAQKVVVCYGAQGIDWICFETMLARLRDVETVGRMQHTCYAAAVLASDAMRIVDGKAFWTRSKLDIGATALEYLLVKYRDMQSAETRDRVYGFLGLVEDAAGADAKPAIVVDYSMSIRRVFDETNKSLQVFHPAGSLKKKLELIELAKDALRLSSEHPAVHEAKLEATCATWIAPDVSKYYYAFHERAALRRSLEPSRLSADEEWSELAPMGERITHVPRPLQFPRATFQAQPNEPDLALLPPEPQPANYTSREMTLPEVTHPAPPLQDLPAHAAGDTYRGAAQDDWVYSSDHNVELSLPP